MIPEGIYQLFTILIHNISKISSGFVFAILVFLFFPSKEFSFKKRIPIIGVFIVISCTIPSILSLSPGINDFYSFVSIVILFSILILPTKAIYEVIKCLKNGEEKFLLNKIKIKDKKVKNEIKEWKNNICQLSEECILALNSGEYDVARNLFKRILSVIETTENWILAYYLKIVLNKGEIPSKHINSICKHSKVLISTIEKHPNRFKEVLEALIQTVNPDHKINKIDLALSKLSKVEKRKNSQYKYTKESILRKNLELWKKYGIFITWEDIFLPVLSIFLFILFVFLLKYLSSFLINLILILTIPFLVCANFLWILFENKRTYADLSQKIIIESLKKDKNDKNKFLSPIKSKLRKLYQKDNVFPQMKYFVEAYGILDSTDLIDRLNDESKKILNYSFLAYCVMTFPGKKIINYKLIDKDNFIRQTTLFKFEQIKCRRFTFFLKRLKIYLLIYPTKLYDTGAKKVFMEFINIIKSISAVVSFLIGVVLLYVGYSESFNLRLVYFSISFVYLGLITLWGFWKGRRHFNIGNCIFLISLILMSIRRIMYFLGHWHDFDLILGVAIFSIIILLSSWLFWENYKSFRKTKEI